MSSKNVYDKFKDLSKDDKLVCTKKDLDEFILYGILLQSGGKYITRDNKFVEVDLIKTKQIGFDLDLRYLIQQGNHLYKQTKHNKIYFMTEGCYKRYKEQGFIITKNNQDFYRMFDKELWLVCVI